MIRGFGFSIDDDRAGLFLMKMVPTPLVLQIQGILLFLQRRGINHTPALSSFFGCSPVQMIPCLKIC